MFWLILLAMPHHRRRHYHRRGRFQHPLYWATGLALIETELWIAAGLILAAWWLLWIAARGLTRLADRFWCVPDPVLTAIGRCRPPWPSRAAVQRHIAQSRPRRVVS